MAHFPERLQSLHIIPENTWDFLQVPGSNSTTDPPSLGSCEHRESPSSTFWLGPRMFNYTGLAGCSRVIADHAVSSN